MNNTQKALINQDVCEQTTPNLGITQSSGLDHHAVYSRQRVDDFRENGVVSTQSARQLLLHAPERQQQLLCCGSLRYGIAAQREQGVFG